jgi:biotin carboxylase
MSRHAPQVKVTVLSRDKWAPIRASYHHSGFIHHTIDTFDEKRVEAICDATQRAKADIILPAALPCTRLVAEYSQELSKASSLPPLASKDLINTFSDKWHFTQLLRKIGAPHPKSTETTGFDFARSEDGTLRFPVLVKARNLSSGDGIRICRDTQELRSFLDAQEDPDDFIVQEFITGPDISSSVLAENGKILAQTTQLEIIPSFKPFKSPAAVQFIYKDEIRDIIQHLIRATGWSGICNFDFVYDEESKEPKLLEANPRYWRSVLGSLVAGVNFPHLACRTSKGERYPLPAYREIRYSKPDRAVGLLARGMIGSKQKISRLDETGIPFTLKDPLPDLLIQATKVFQRLSPGGERRASIRKRATSRAG